MNPTEKRQWWVSQWLKKAEHDLRAAELLTQGADPPTDVICFHAHQAVEKLLKAFLVAHDVEFEKTHDLGILLDRCREIDQEFEELNEYAVSARYPGLWEEYPAEEAEGALASAKRVRDFVLGRGPRFLTPD